MRVAATVAVLAMAAVGLLVYHKRHQLFDRDPSVENDSPAERHMRAEEVVLVWSGLTILMVSILVQVWVA